MAQSANLVMCSGILRRWLDVTVPNQTQNQINAVNIFQATMMNLQATGVHIDEQVLVETITPLADEFDILWDEKLGILHGCMEWILDQVETANPETRLERITNALSEVCYNK